MAHMIAIKANQISYLGGGGSSPITAEMPCLAVVIAAWSTRPIDPIMCLAALAIAVSTLLAARSSIKTLGFLHQNPNHLPMLCLPVPYLLQINLLFPRLGYHVVQCREGGKTNKLLNIWSQHWWYSLRSQSFVAYPKTPSLAIAH